MSEMKEYRGCAYEWIETPPFFALEVYRILAPNHYEPIRRILSKMKRDDEWAHKQIDEEVFDEWD
jgi:hypothetical protein